MQNSRESLSNPLQDVLDSFSKSHLSGPLTDGVYIPVGMGMGFYVPAEAHAEIQKLANDTGRVQFLGVSRSGEALKGSRDEITANPDSAGCIAWIFPQPYAQGVCRVCGLPCGTGFTCCGSVCLEKERARGAAAAARERIGNTSTCEDCEKPLDLCECGESCQHDAGEDCMTCAGCGRCDETLDEKLELCDRCRGRLEEYARACNLDVEPLRSHIFGNDPLGACQFIEWLQAV